MLFLVTIAGWIMGLSNVSNWLKNWVPWCWHATKIPSFQERATNALKDGVNKVGDEIGNIFGTGSKNATTVTAMVANSTGGVCDEFTGYTAVYRLMFATTVFFVVLGVLMIKVKSSRDPRVPLHRGSVLYLFSLEVFTNYFLIIDCLQSNSFSCWHSLSVPSSFLHQMASTPVCTIRKNL